MYCVDSLIRIGFIGKAESTKLDKLDTYQTIKLRPCLDVVRTPSV